MTVFNIVIVFSELYHIIFFIFSKESAKTRPSLHNSFFKAARA